MTAISTTVYNGWAFGQAREWLAEHDFRFCSSNARGIHTYRRRGTLATVEVLPALREMVRDERPCVLVVRKRP